jgi:hypothetical protein
LPLAGQIHAHDQRVRRHRLSLPTPSLLLTPKPPRHQWWSRKAFQRSRDLPTGRHGWLPRSCWGFSMGHQVRISQPEATALFLREDSAILRWASGSGRLGAASDPTGANRAEPEDSCGSSD